MQLERRRYVRRAISGGVVLGALSFIPVGLMELAYVLFVPRPAFDSYAEGLRFCAYLLLLLGSTGAVVGTLEGLVSLGVSLVSKSLAKQRLAEPRWMAWIYSMLALPVIAVVTARVFSGRRAAELPGKHLMAVGLGLAALVATYAAVRVIIGVRDRFRIRRWGPRQALLLIAACLPLGAALYVADQRVLVRLYPFFHVVLALGVVAMFQLGAGVVYMGFRPTARWMGRLAEPSVALLILVGGLAGIAWSLSRIEVHQNLRFMYHEHTAVQGKVLELVRAVGIGRAAPLTAHDIVPLPALPDEALRAGPRLPDANIVLLSVDALRADHMGVYGYGRRTTPNIDRMAREAAVFSRGYCQVPHTSFSITSMMTGSYVYSLSRVEAGRRQRTVAEVLRRYGYKTGAFFPPAVFYIDRDKFAAYEDTRYGFEYAKFEYVDAGRRVAQIMRFLSENRGRKFFVWAHFFEPHEPYQPRTDYDFGRRAVDRYDGEIAYVDHHIGKLLRYLDRHHPNTVVAITADHGEEFGEHGGHYHGNAMYEQQVRVPVIVRVPGVDGRRVDGPAQVIDVPVTLLSVVDVPLPASMRGTDLSPWLAGESADRLPPAFSEMDRKNMIVDGHDKLVCDDARGYCELYDLAADPDERHNLYQREATRAGQLRARLLAWMGSHVPRGDDADGEEARVQRVLDRARQNDIGAVPELVELCSGPLEVRREAVRLLTQMRAGTGRDALAAASADEDPGVRLQAVVGAALLGHAASLARLQQILARPDLPPDLERDALLARAAAGDRRATLPLARQLSATEDMYERVEIIRALGELRDPAAGPALRRQLDTLRTRVSAIRALGQIADRRAVPLLLESLRRDRFISWREASAVALGRIGASAARAGLQRAVAVDVEVAVVAEALSALRRLGGLPVPGLTGLPAGALRCDEAGRCVADVAAHCEEGMHDQELLVVWDAPEPAAPGRARAGIAGGAPPDKGRRIPLAVRCGDATVATVQMTPSGAGVAQLTESGQGPLQLVLDSAGEVQSGAPVLRYVALRRPPPPPESRSSSATTAAKSSAR